MLFKKTFLTFLACVVFAVVFLIAGSLLPQEAVDRNLTESMQTAV